MKTRTTTGTGLLTLVLAMVWLLPFAAEANQDQALALMKRNQCNKCHTIKAVGFQKDPTLKDDEGDEEEAKDDKEAPDLSGVGKKHDADWMELFLQKREKIKGRKHTRRFKGTPEELTLLTKWLETLKN
ncbi:MAG: cytochrome c [Oligoflexia bacterium]|nr:cytochrome c [Oligoflexia bacterium]